MAKGKGRCSNILARDSGRSSVAPSKKMMKERNVIIRQSKRKNDELMASLFYLCQATQLEMQRLLRCCGLSNKHYK
ncbi:hypothetical protein PVK06_039620 [Gossypium arboreum]|uniref:Uncharacterized protein n=1 Tax=Gossypium arboreum TaxID=29729 RepID=A0ABR0N3F3_GOSAR|nr:hypothetical protein PVK06_039620 [Gossypium arboreum]